MSKTPTAPISNDADLHAALLERNQIAGDDAAHARETAATHAGNESGEHELGKRLSEGTS